MYLGTLKLQGKISISNLSTFNVGGRCVGAEALAGIVDAELTSDKYAQYMFERYQQAYEWPRNEFLQYVARRVMVAARTHGFDAQLENVWPRECIAYAIVCEWIEAKK